MMGRPKTAPNWPGLVTVKVEPSNVFGLELLISGALTEIGDSALQA